MIITNIFIGSLKAKTADEAKLLAIPINNSNNTLIGSMVPIGDWILSEESIISSFVKWRQKSKKMFPTQIDVNYESTISYLKKSSIANDVGILFLIYDNDNKLIGHIGLANIQRNSFELVNLMRGENGGDPRLIYHAEFTLLSWGFKNLHAQRVEVEVMSYNWLVASLHEEIGFMVSEKLSLKKVEVAMGIIHEVVEPSQSNVNYSILKLKLTADSFVETGKNMVCHH